MIDTALLIAGALTARMYFTANTPEETELRELVETLYLRIDWRWSQGGAATIRQGWKPECGFLHYGWDGYNEAIVLYVLAMGSPTHPVTDDCYEAWTATYQWENLYGYDFLYAGPLFVHQFSHAWIDFRGIRDSFMREKRCDYFENSRRASQIQREYAQRNPHEFAGYDENCWGLSACDGPIDVQPDVPHETQRVFGYAARGVPYGPDDGTLSATVRTGVAAVRTRDRHGHHAQHDGALSGDGVRRPFLEQLQPDAHRRRWACMGFRGALRARSGHRVDDDRKLSQRTDLAADAQLPRTSATACTVPDFAAAGCQQSSIHGAR